MISMYVFKGIKIDERDVNVKAAIINYCFWTSNPVTQPCGP